MKVPYLEVAVLTSRGREGQDGWKEAGSLGLLHTGNRLLHTDTTFNIVKSCT
jgi:hypothetical protein